MHIGLQLSAAFTENVQRSFMQSRHHPYLNVLLQKTLKSLDLSGSRLQGTETVEHNKRFTTSQLSAEHARTLPERLGCRIWGSGCSEDIKI